MANPEKAQFLNFLSKYNDPNEQYIDTSLTSTGEIKDLIRESIQRSDGRRPTAIQIKNGAMVHDLSIEDQRHLKTRFILDQTDYEERFRENFFRGLDQKLSGAEIVIFTQEKPKNQ